MSSIKWLPLESNPDVMNKFLRNLGVPSCWGITDIISLDEELLQLIPSPALAILLLFPTSQQYYDYCQEHENRAKQEKQEFDEDLYFMHQSIKNACGTVALIHAIANNMSLLNLPSDSVVKNFVEATKKMSPAEKALYLERSGEIGAAHDASAQQGQTEAPRVDDMVNLHFIALVNVNGKLYELDGRQQLPVFHGRTTQETYVRDACKICQEYIDRDPESFNFTALSFGAM